MKAKLWVTSIIVVGTIVCFVLLNKQSQEDTSKAKSLNVDEYESAQPLAQTEKNLENPIASSTPNPSEIRLPIVMYHYVEYVKDKKDKLRQVLNIQPNILETQLNSLKKNNFQSYHMADVPMLMSTKTQGKTIILTFDDGYEDFYTYAYPLLKKYQMKATIYVISEFIDKKDYLTRQQLQELSNDPLIEIGAHTTTHEKLNTLPPEKQQEEISNSKKELEQITSKQMNTFAYPFGDYNDTSIEIVKKTGFTTSVSVIPGTYQSPQNIFTLRRIRAGVFATKDIVTTLSKLKY